MTFYISQARLLKKIYMTQFKTGEALYERNVHLRITLEDSVNWHRPGTGRLKRVVLY